MKEAPRVLQFPDAHATVIFKNEVSKATGKKHARLYVQCIDQYRYQREWSLELRHKSGDSKTLYWESHVYMHPGRRRVCEVGADQAERCIRRFLELCEHYASLLFNSEGEHATNKARPRAEGFVQFCETLHRGAVPSSTIL